MEVGEKSVNDSFEVPMVAQLLKSVSLVPTVMKSDVLSGTDEKLSSSAKRQHAPNYQYALAELVTPLPVGVFCDLFGVNIVRTFRRKQKRPQSVCEQVVEVLDDGAL
ncbi:hypothetical protein V2A60_008558 [Cordyceps javanica]